MNTKTNDLKTCEIARCEKFICGNKVQYKLIRCSDEIYRICVSDDLSKASAEFKANFFDIVGLFKTMVDTETLPTNIPDISEDYNFLQQM